MEQLKPLDSLEREWFTETLNNPVFQRALEIIAAQKPGVFPLDGFGLTPEQQRKKESDRVYEIRGWEMYHAALKNVNQVEEAKPPPPEMPEETYPDEDEEPEND